MHSFPDSPKVNRQEYGKLNSGEILHLFRSYRDERRMYMDVSLLLEYGWVLLILIALEGILAADNALVLAIMVKHLPEEKRKKALFYGLAGHSFSDLDRYL